MNSRNPFTSATFGRSEGNETVGRNRVLSLVCVLAFAIAAMVIIPAGASAFNVANFSYNNTPTASQLGWTSADGGGLQASGHPNVIVNFDRQGSESEDLKDIQLDLPAGVFANPEAAPKCSDAQFNADTCPASTQVGTAQIKVKALSLLDQTIPGTIDLLEASPGQTATIGISLDPAPICLILFCAEPEKIFLKTGITVNTFDDSSLRTYTPGQPSSAVIGIPLIFFTPTITGDITVNSVKLQFQARSGTPVGTKKCGWFGLNCTWTYAKPTGPYFFRQAGSCVANSAIPKITLISYQNASSTLQAPYTPTNCAAVGRTLNTTSFTPTIKAYQEPSPVNYTVTVPEPDATIQHALPRVVDVDFPLGSGINLEALNGVTSCSETQLRAKACPASSIIGNATALTKYIPEGLVGTVYATGDVGNQVPIAVLLKGSRTAKTTPNVRPANDHTWVIFRGTLGVRGNADDGTGRAYSRFDRIPQLPFRSFSLNLTKSLYVNPPTCGTKTTTSTINQFSDTPTQAPVVKTSTYDIPAASCPTVPVTTITNGPPNPTTNNTPPFTFSANTPAATTTFQCSMDGAPYQLCSSPYTSPSLTNGPHTFRVYAVNGTIVDATPAEYTFSVNTSGSFTIDLSATPTTYNAGAHPDLLAVANIAGGQPKTLQIKMPAGFNASLAAVANCPTASALAGTCAANTKVGDSQLTVNTFAGSQTGLGEIYLTDGPTAADAGGVAVKITMPFGTFIAQAGAYLVNNGGNQYLDIRNFPTNINGTEFTVTQLRLDFDGAANSFLTNPSKCAADTFSSTGTAFDGSVAAVDTVPFTAINCAAMLFAPTTSQSFTSLQAGTTSKVTANVDVPVGHSSIQNMTVLEPPVFGPNTVAFGRNADMCPGSSASATTAFNPAACPAQAKVGTMTLNTPLLTAPLVGEVYLVNKTPLPWFGVKFDQPGISVRLTGFTDIVKVDPLCNEATDPNGYCQTQISVEFKDLPDVPITHVTFALNSDPRPRPAPLTPLPGEILVLADPGDATCQASSPAKSIINSNSGKTVNSTQNLTITGC